MGLYIQLHSMHGLFRGRDLELGRDEDTGGQIIYVLELAKALSKISKVDEVEIFTRKIVDEKYPGYSEDIEKVADKVNIVRIPCGPKKYIKKVNLWPYLDEFIKGTIKYISRKKRVPDIFQSNYADSGLVCVRLSKHYGKPQVHTGHSLGIPKMKRMGVNKNNFESYDKVFKFSKRLNAEQEVIENAKIIIGSTSEEIKQQYASYKIAKHTQKFRNIAPGIDLEKFYPPRSETSEDENYVYRLMDNVINQDLKYPKRRVFSVLTRMDKRKNIHGLLQAFGEDKKLQQMANLIIFSNTLSADKGIQRTINRINKIIRDKDLYDSLALPGITLHYEQQVPAYYRYLARKKGVFVNPALLEPFGLTILEASACGVPVVATKYGGPSEIIDDGVNGLLMDVNNQKDMVSKLRRIFSDDKLWNTISKNGIINARENYSWISTAKKYLQAFEEAKDAACK